MAIDYGVLLMNTHHSKEEGQGYKKVTPQSNPIAMLSCNSWHFRDTASCTQLPYLLISCVEYHLVSKIQQTWLAAHGVHHDRFLENNCPHAWEHHSGWWCLCPSNPHPFPEQLLRSQLSPPLQNHRDSQQQNPSVFWWNMAKSLLQAFLSAPTG